tara:strand:+ start:165927 stop:166589 length:663 start_codon:yes stop_codon:yes gene_type:complete
MKFENFFEDPNSRSALTVYSKEQRRAMAKACNNAEFIRKVKHTLSSRTKKMLEGVNIVQVSARFHQSIAGRELRPIIDYDVSTFFTTVNGKPWIIINSDIPLAEVTLVHEAIIFEQWRRGDLNFVEKGVVWKGTIYPNDLIAETFTDDKKNEQWKYLPWKLEAFGRQFTDAQVQHIRKNGNEETVKGVNAMLAFYGRVVPDAPAEELTETGDVEATEKPE